MKKEAAPKKTKTVALAGKLRPTIFWDIRNRLPRKIIKETCYALSKAEIVQKRPEKKLYLIKTMTISHLSNSHGKIHELGFELVDNLPFLPRQIYPEATFSCSLS